MGHTMLIIQIIVSIILPAWLYFWFSKQVKKYLPSNSGLRCSILDVHYLLKRWWAEWCIIAKEDAERIKLRDFEKYYQKIEYTNSLSDNPKIIKDKESCNSVFFYAADQKGNSVFIKFARRRRRTAEVSLQFMTSDGQVYVLPDYPDTIVTTSPHHEWSAVDLKIELLESMQRWRITYNGMLRNLASGDSPSDENIEHIRLNLIFIASARPLRWPEDWSPRLHSEALALLPWRNPQWMDKIKLMDYSGFDQWGSIIGQVTYKDSTTNSLYLRGICQRRWGKHESHQFHKTVTLFGIMPTGTMFYIGATNTKHTFPHIRFGHVKESCNKISRVDWTSLVLDDFTEDVSNINKQQTMRFTANGIDYNVLINFGNSITLYSGQSWNWANKITNLKLDLKGRTGIGIMQVENPSNELCKRRCSVGKLLKKPKTTIQKDDYVLFFNDEKCQNENIVGGKGYSLAILTSITDSNFIVPEGFCITVLAFEMQLQSNKELQQVIDDVESVCTGRRNGDLDAYCKEAVHIIRNTPLIEPVKDAILTALDKLESSLISENNESHRYAVRSSAIGEDSEETSAAGQNSTYLGVKGADNVVKSVAMCWASLFSYQSVQYRRQHGLPIAASMGVCVQRMVNAKAAGVMFTRHPTTGDPSNIIITANYGLGETVVSAMVEPDTITIHRSWDNKLSVKSSVLGNKTEKILMNDSGVVTMNVEEKDIQTVCISHKVALQLAEIGLYLETLFGTARDIEWAVKDDTIFLLQARPITTLTTWTDFELMHELDSGVPSDIDIMTFANIGEVLPKPLSPLSVSTTLRLFNASIAVKQSEFDCVYLNSTAYRCTISYFNTLLRFANKDISMMNKVVDIAICGRVVITPEINNTAIERNGLISPGLQAYLFYDMLRELWLNSRKEKEAIDLDKSFTLNIDEYHTASSLYNEINKKFETLCEMATIHSFTSRVSIIYQALAMSLLTNGYNDFLAEHFTDIAILLSSCSDVVSSEVPVALESIAKTIRHNNKADEFAKIDPANAISWLKINCPEAAAQVDNLLKKHGHRCIQELDFMSESWSQNPYSLFTTIQTLVTSPEENHVHKELSVEETIASLKTPKSAFTKWLLRKVVPYCRDAVKRREMTKAVTVKAAHKVKLAYRKLGALMVSENYLPSANLIFFLTHHEIGHLLNKRSPGLLLKAQRRNRLFSQLNELQYPEFSTGMVLPIKITSDPVLHDGNTKIQGTSVCSGSILGRACVITDLAEATKIQQGDILITRATDIGWSPYFPLLSGIVTELGGLISHGAVVAREYGLPCIVGAKGATHIFQTGDRVLLAADVGVLELIEKA